MSQILIRPSLAWDELPEDASRSRRINTVALVLGILCFLIIPNIKLPKIERSQQEAVPERMATIIREKKVELPPPPPKPVETKKLEPDKPAETVAKSKPMEIKDTTKKPSETATAKEIGEARAKAGNALKASGVADALADLRDFETAGEAMAKNPSTGGDLQKNSGEPVGTSRNMIGRNAGAGSGGIGAYAGGASSGFGGGVAGGKGGSGNFSLGAKGAKDMKGGLIAVQGVAGGGKGGGGGGGGRGEGGVGKRTQEEIRAVFDRYSGKIFSAYVRATKDDPSLEGVLRLKLVIDPDGSVIECSVASSELNNEDLEKKIVAIVKGFNFGADNVEQWKGTFPVNLFPK